MSQVVVNEVAPDWALADYTGRMVRLSDYRGAKSVLLVFNRGLF
jgi:peroxiredoxin